jgi:hypothetical protein
MLRQTRVWLDIHFAADTRHPKVDKLVTGLIAYLRHCERRLAAGESGSATIARRVNKIRDACNQLWTFAQKGR